MKTLTSRQTEILRFIQDTVASSGIPPTVAEITQAMGVKSTNGIRGHLQALARKQVIELLPNASRGIRLIQSTEEEEEPNGLPIVGRVAAGSPILAEQHIEDRYAISPDLFHPRADYLLRVNGMSMRDVGILDGDLLAVHRSPKAENGEIIVARLDDEVTVKRLSINGYMAYLKAENPDFQTIKVDMRQQSLEIEGKAVGVLRHL